MTAHLERLALRLSVMLDLTKKMQHMYFRQKPIEYSTITLNTRQGTSVFKRDLLLRLYERTFMVTTYFDDEELLYFTPQIQEVETGFHVFMSFGGYGETSFTISVGKNVREGYITRNDKTESRYCDGLWSALLANNLLPR